LRNERYCGDVLARKTFTLDFLTHKSVRNRGERNQYYKQDHHEAIVTREQWNAAQKILRSQRYQYSGTYIPMTVIEDGILQGYISINRSWAGDQIEEYLEACRQAMGEIVEENPDEAVLIEEMEQLTDEAVNVEPRDGFQVVRGEMFSHFNEPFMCISRRFFFFSRQCISMLGNEGELKTTIELLLNPLTKMIAVRPCAAEHPNAMTWTNSDGSARKLGGTQLCRMIYELLGIDDDYNYRFPALLRKNDSERILFFDLCNYSGRLLGSARELRRKRAKASAQSFIPDENEENPSGKPIEVRSNPDMSRSGHFGEYYEIHQQILRNLPTGDWNIHDPGRALGNTCRISQEEMERLDQEILAVSIAEEQMRKEKEAQEKLPKALTEEEAHRALGENHGI
jgi:Recombinase.